MGRTTRWFLLACVGSFFAVSATAEAAYVAVGDNPIGWPYGYAYQVGTTMPFARSPLQFGGCNSTTVVSGRYQQVYRASEFLSAPGVLNITQLAFRTIQADSGDSFPYSRVGFDMTMPNATITLSTTSVEPLYMSGDFDRNLAADAAVVFQGDLHLSTPGRMCDNGPNCLTDFNIIVALETPFRYDPQAGNLLLDVRYPSGSGLGTSGVTSSAGTCGIAYAAWTSPFVDANLARYITASAWSDTGSTGADLRGLVTRFTYDLSAPQPPLRSFVYELYGHALGRNPDAAGLRDWETYLGSHCDATGFTTAADAFFDSLEFRTNRHKTMAELAADLYRALLTREPDAAGQAGWAADLKQARLEVALQGFLPSPEFQLTLPNRTDRAAVTALVSRFYVHVLNRGPDDAGLQGWVNYVVATGDVNGTALSFLGSAEFDARRLTFREYVTILYRAFFAREPDAPGLGSWDQVLRTHLLEVIDHGFIPSVEFQAHVAQECH